MPTAAVAVSWRNRDSDSTSSRNWMLLGLWETHKPAHQIGLHCSLIKLTRLRAVQFRRYFGLQPFVRRVAQEDADEGMWSAPYAQISGQRGLFCFERVGMILSVRFLLWFWLAHWSQNLIPKITTKIQHSKEGVEVIDPQPCPHHCKGVLLRDGGVRALVNIFTAMEWYDVFLHCYGLRHRDDIVPDGCLFALCLWLIFSISSFSCGLVVVVELVVGSC